MHNATIDYSGSDFYCYVALKGLEPLKKEYESEQVLAYHHTRPFWPVHIVVIPKKHIASLATFTEADSDRAFRSPPISCGAHRS